MAAAKKQFRCAQCGKQTSTSYAVRAKARLCGTCWPDIDMPRPLREKSASARSVAAPAKRRRAAKPVVEAVAASVAAKPVAPAKGKKAAVPAPAPMGEAKPAAVPSAEVVALDQRIAEVREAMNRLASDLSAKRIELAALRDQRRALGPLPRSKRDPDAPRRMTLLDAAAKVLYDAKKPMQAKAIWQAIVERDLWSTPNGGKTPYATLAATMLREMADKGAAARFVKAGRGLFAATLS